MKLTATEVKAFARADHGADKKLADGRGLYLLATKAGGRYWKLRAWINGQETTVALGQWPEMGLAEARVAAQGHRSTAKQGINPTGQKRELAQQKTAAAENTVAVVAAEWLATWSKKWKADGTVVNVQRYVDYVVRELGDKGIADITSGDALLAFERIEQQSTSGMAKKALQTLDRVMRRAKLRNLIHNNPVAGLARDLDAVQTGNYPAAVSRKEIRAVLESIKGYRGSTVTRGALLAAPYLAVRPGELVEMRWSDIHSVDGGFEWRFVSRKKGVPHTVWLAPRVMEILKAMPKRGNWVFPGRTGGHITRSALAIALNRMGMGDVQTVHGWRATFRTVGAEELGFDVAQMEIQLSHTLSSDPMKGAYARARYENQRRAMMQTWADWLDELQKSD